MREVIVGTTTIGPFSPAIVAEGRFVFVAGQGPLRRHLRPGSIEEETRLTLENVAGCSSRRAVASSTSSAVACGSSTSPTSRA